MRRLQPAVRGRDRQAAGAVLGVVVPPPPSAALWGDHRAQGSALHLVPSSCRSPERARLEAQDP